MKSKDVLISGAGPAGMTLAFWLKKYGFNPTVIERANRLRLGGYKIDIRGEAVEAIKLMGIYDEVYKHRTDLKETKYVNKAGKVISEAHPDEAGIRAEGDLEIVRGAFCEILYDKVKDCEFIFGDSIEKIHQDADKVDVTFKSGNDRSFSFVFGAEGLHSKTRNLVFGPEEKFLKQLGSLYIAFSSVPNYLNLDRVEFEYQSPKRFGIMYCPADGNAVAGVGFSAKDHGYDITKRENQFKLIEELYGDAGWEFKNIIKYMKESDDFYFDYIAQIKIDRWSKGRVSLCGDTGYCLSPMSGQGTSAALLGAYVLAGELASHGDDYNKAFAQYEKEFRVYTEANGKLAELSLKFMEGGFLTWLMLKVMRLSQLSRVLMSKMIDRFKKKAMKNMKKSSNIIKLKDYSQFYVESGKTTS